MNITKFVKFSMSNSRTVQIWKTEEKSFEIVFYFTNFKNGCKSFLGPDKESETIMCGKITEKLNIY
jgi:hypothetical protein